MSSTVGVGALEINVADTGGSLSDAKFGITGSIGPTAGVAFAATETETTMGPEMSWGQVGENLMAQPPIFNVFTNIVNVLLSIPPPEEPEVEEVEEQ